MKTILAEKPSQAKHYADALTKLKGESFVRKDGYFESSNFIITWAFGHIIQLENDKVYHNYDKWSLDYLPLIPSEFKYTIGKDAKGNVDAGKKKQLEVIKSCFEKATEIINGTDADREGELIFNYIYNYVNCKKRVERLWLNSLTENEIIKGLEKLKQPDELFIKSGYLRAILDWVVGINGTQCATLKMGAGKKLTIGRVQTVMLKLICEKYLKNKNFSIEKFYKIKCKHTLNGVDFFSESESFESKEEIYKIELNKHHVVDEYKVEIKNINNPLFYSINTLIIDANKLLNLKTDITLKLAQSLYEKKLISYPRTDNEYINEENYQNLKSFIGEIGKLIQLDIPKFSDKPRGVDNKKVDSSHDAIIPTGEKNGIEKLEENEKLLFELIVRRTLQAIHKERLIVENVKISFLNNRLFFTSYSKQIKQKGWSEQVYNFNEKEVNKLPILEKNQTIEIIEKSIAEGNKTPPLLANTENITKELSNAHKLIEENNIEIPEGFDIKNVEIGTQSTRSILLKGLEDKNYIEYKNKNYIPTSFGLEYYNSIKDLYVANYIFTINTEINLYKIANGLMSENDFKLQLQFMALSIVKNILNTDTIIKNEKKSFGKCPKCNQGEIVENAKGYGCSNYKSGCGFIIWKESFGKKLSEMNIKDLVMKKKTKLIKFKSTKTNKEYNAYIIIKSDQTLGLEFEK